LGIVSFIICYDLAGLTPCVNIPQQKSAPTGLMLCTSALRATWCSLLRRWGSCYRSTWKAQAVEMHNNDAPVLRSGPNLVLRVVRRNGRQAGTWDLLHIYDGFPFGCQPRRGITLFISACCSTLPLCAAYCCRGRRSSSSYSSPRCRSYSSSIGWVSGCTNPVPEFKAHGHEFRFLFILEDQAFFGLMKFILRARFFFVYLRLKILVHMFNGGVHP
jgi:hypothetical protein